jgi:uncharacterized membrane protein
LILLGIFFRFNNLGLKEFWHDETGTAMCLNGPPKGAIAGLFNGTIIKAGDLKQYTQLNPSIGIPEVIDEQLVHVGAFHPPLFYVLTYLWAGLVGSGVTTLRLLPAFLSLLQLWGAFMLGREMSGSKLMGPMAAALISLSPVFLFFAQELREYSLLQGVILITSAYFLRALRKPVVDGGGWFAHLAWLIVSLYNSLETVFLIIAEFAYIRFRKGLRSSSARFLSTTCVIAGVLFTPWCTLILSNLKSFMEDTAWTSTRVPLDFLVRVWLDNCSYVFVDFGSLDELGAAHHIASKVIMSIVLCVELLAVALLCSRFRRRTSFILILMLANAVPLIFLDLVVGGFRSDVIRYCIPVTISLVMSVAYLLHEAIVRGKLAVRIIFCIVAAYIFSVEIASDWEMSQATVWNGKQIGRQSLFSMASVINQDKEKVLIVSDNANGSNWEQIVALSRYIKPDVSLQMFGPTLSLPSVPAGVDHFYVLNPSKELLKLLVDSKKYDISQCRDMDYFDICTVRKSNPDNSTKP